jgi:hypothetical protein
LLDWEHNFAATIGGIMHMVASKSHRWGLLGSSEPYSHPIVPWGSSPSTDYLVSGGVFSLVHDGAGYSRTEKAAFLANFPEALKSLRVCYADTHSSSNCGRCEKCIRTRLNFLAVGVENAPMFDGGFRLEMLDRINLRTVAQRNEMASILDYADAHKLAAPWVDKVRTLVHGAGKASF